MSVEKFEFGHFYRARHNGAPPVLYVRNDAPGGLGSPLFVYLKEGRAVDARRADPALFDEVQPRKREQGSDG